jgi:hypothetical protein
MPGEEQKHVRLEVLNDLKYTDYSSPQGCDAV